MFSLFSNKKKSITNVFPSNFVDIHSHLLPNLDDGSKSLNESVLMIKRMMGYGIHKFICTPHVMEGVWENSSYTIKNKLYILKEHLKSENINDIQISAAAEYMLDNNFMKLLEEKDILTLKDSYILVEMPFINAPINLYELIFDIQMAGYKPVLAHPERYLFLHQKYSEYDKLKNAGCLFQLNLLSLSNFYGKEVNSNAVKLLKEGFIDFVGSDTHNDFHLEYMEKMQNSKLIKLVQPILEKNSLFS
jgi:tyrosine-protein phosphatase YwqE